MHSSSAVTPSSACALWRIEGDLLVPHLDLVAAEEPLEIKLGYVRDGVPVKTVVALTMRTPGADAELAVGFLHNEGILKDRPQIEAITLGIGGEHRRMSGSTSRDALTGAEICVHVRDRVAIDLDALRRYGTTTSACGACGKTSRDALRVESRFSLHDDPLTIGIDLVHRLPAALRGAQEIFDQTGGLHAAALFDETGRLVDVREDVGRHNAVDKLIGAQFLADRLPLRGHVLFVSGRASFELVQKAAMAGVPVLAAVGAPSSLAVSLAREAGLTLLGFVRDQRFNVYSGFQRVPQLATAGRSQTAA